VDEGVGVEAFDGDGRRERVDGRGEDGVRGEAKHGAQAFSARSEAVSHGGVKWGGARIRCGCELRNCGFDAGEIVAHLPVKLWRVVCHGCVKKTKEGQGDNPNDDLRFVLCSNEKSGSPTPKRPALFLSILSRCTTPSPIRRICVTIFVAEDVRESKHFSCPRKRFFAIFKNYFLNHFQLV
jgi:hypothetical protein